MAQMLTIPYARQQAYRNPQYVAAMADLMIRRGDTASAAALMKGQNTQQLMQNLGTLTMGTFAGIGKQRDEERDRAIIQAERDREYALKQQEMKERKAEREADLAYRNRLEKRQADLDRDKRAEEETSLSQVGTVVPMSAFAQTNIPGSPSARAWTPQGYEAARLPATPMADMEAGFASYATPPVASGGIPQFAPTPASSDPEWFKNLPSAPPTSISPPRTAAGAQSEYALDPVKRTMSTDVAERPEGMRRQASQAELVQLETLRRQAEAAQQLAQDRRDDNAARDEAARALAEYRKEQLRLGQARVDASREGGGGVPVIQEAGGQLWRIPKDGGPAVPVVTADNKPLKKFADTSGLGDYQNAVAFALGKVPQAKQGSVVATAERLMREDNKPELLAFLKKTVTDNISGTERQQVLGRDGAIASLNDARAVLQQLKAKGVNTGLLTGKVEDVRRYLGKTGNPELVELGTMLANSLGNYRRAMTGLAFSDTESKDYAKQWPSYLDEFPVNEAKINGLLNAMSSYDRSFWLSQLGPSAATIFGTGSAAPAGGTGKPKATFGPDGKLVLPR